jgi:hypothetical protein
MTSDKLQSKLARKNKNLQEEVSFNNILSRIKNKYTIRMLYESLKIVVLVVLVASMVA